MSTRIHPEDLHALEEQLTLRLESIAPQPRSGAADRVRSQVAAIEQRHGLLAWLGARTQDIQPRQSATAAAVILLAVTVGLGISRSGVLTTIHPSAPAKPTAATRPTPAPSGSTAPRVGEIYQIWDRSNLPQPAGQAPGVPHDIVAFKGRLLIVGGAKTAACAGAPCISETTAAVWRLKGGPGSACRISPACELER